MYNVQRTWKWNSKTALADHYLRPKGSRQNIEEETLVMLALNSGTLSLPTLQLTKTYFQETSENNIIWNDRPN